MMPERPDNAEFNAWNPGLESEIPPEFARLETIFRPGNTTTGFEEIAELAELTGLRPEELVVFSPRRLVVHELLVRVSADIAVPEGEAEEAFGIHFRRIATRILAGYLAPHYPALEAAWSSLYDSVDRQVRDLLAEAQDEPAAVATPRPTLRQRLFGRRPESPPSRPSRQEREFQLIARFKARGLAATDPLEKAIYRSLYRVLGAMAGRRGYIGPDHALLAKLVSRHVCNGYGSSMIGSMIEPWIREAMTREGYATIPSARTPVLFSLKGASAAGKSSLRPMLKQHVREQGIEVEQICTISPDIWRRFLLDYESLGLAYKYAGRLTGQEIIVIDAKLDRYIRAKASRDRAIPHLLVDRFRFDSFASEKVARILRDTYARYVDTMYMYFIVTPPEETVERGWRRGLERGRYKAVEDFLDHSVEAYVGMPKILFRWLAQERPLYRYEFLDNSVPKGTYPRTIARGTQMHMLILDPVAMVNIERYQKINIRARSPAEVYPDDAILAVENNMGFLRLCVQRIPRVEFEDPDSGRQYLVAEAGRFEVLHAETFGRVRDDPQIDRLFRALVPRL